MFARVETVVLEGGRRVAVHELSEGSSGRTIVLCHPSPGAGTLDPDPEETRARDVTLLAIDRPGYGQSDPLPDSEWSSVGRAADDLAEVLDLIGIEAVGIAGWSAGGRVALALAARRPDLVQRVAVVATPAPHEHVPWIPPEQEAGLHALAGLPPAEVQAALRQFLTPLVPGDPYSPESLSALHASDADAAALARPGAAERLGGMLDAAFSQGAVGVAADIAGYCLQPWGFEPADVEAKTLLLYGSRDPVAASRHGSWWQKHLPAARLEVSPGAGHLLTLSRWGRVLSFLAPRAKRATKATGAGGGEIHGS